MYVKIHQYKEGKILAICDKELIGKKFEEKDLQLEIKESFYKGEECTEKKLLELIKTASSLNIIGKKSIDFAIKNNIIDKEGIIKIQKIPHAISILK